MTDKNLYWRMKRRMEKSISEKGKILLQCESCGAEFSPQIRIGGRLPNNWWICPVCENGK